VKRVVVLPLTEAARLPDFEVIARDRNLAAFVGDTIPDRTRKAYDSDESFLHAVAQGYADRYTFNTLEEAATFAKRKLEDLARAAQLIEDALQSNGMSRQQPEKESGSHSKMIHHKKKA
jgi:hypothetical protein